jgi:hypothetical protein
MVIPENQECSLRRLAKRRICMLALVCITVLPNHVSAKGTVFGLCANLFSVSEEQSPAVRNLVVQDAYEQWLIWEEIANKLNLIKTTDEVSFELVRVARDQIEIWKSATLTPALAASIESQYVNADAVLIPRHIYNRDMNVPFAKLRAELSKLMVRLTASRSAAPVANRLITVKTPTDHPNGLEGELEAHKVRTREDIREAILRSRHFREVDERLGDDPVLIKLLDVFAMIDKASGDGILIRDVSIISDGNYYLPALSIPYVGRAIAEINGQPFAEFWAENYAAKLGRAKARMLLRYGTQMVTPNAQNFLIRMDRNLSPLPQIVARDLPDSYFVAPIAEALGFHDAIVRDRTLGVQVDGDIHPNWANSHFLFGEAGLQSIDHKTLAMWGHAHDMAYITEIEQALGVTIIKNKTRPSAFREFWLPWTPLLKLEDFLFSPAGREKLAEFARNNRLP